MACLNWTFQSISDLQNIYNYIASDSKKYAKIHIQRIREKARLIKDNIRIGRIVPEVENEEIREIIFGNYRIIYRIVNPERIDILTVFHSARILEIH